MTGLTFAILFAGTAHAACATDGLLSALLGVCACAQMLYATVAGMAPLLHGYAEQRGKDDGVDQG